MESQHMNQQSFAIHIGLSPATLSSILQERTRPTLQTVDNITKKFPNINLQWLLYGKGDMFSTPDDGNNTQTIDPGISSDAASGGSQPVQPVLDFGFDGPSSHTSSIQPLQQSRTQSASRQQHQPETNIMKNIDKPSRRITEIRVFYDDQTWESFVPKK